MTTMVILTFPNRLSSSEAERLEKVFMEHCPQLKVMLIDQCSGASVVQIPEELETVFGESVTNDG